MAQHEVPKTAETSAAPPYATDLLIDGSLQPGHGPEEPVIDPATEQVIAMVATASQKQLDEAIAAARDAFEHGPWPTWSGEERRAAILRFADVVEANGDLLMATMVAEMGTPVGLRPIQLDQGIRFLRWSADMAGYDFTESLGPTAAHPGATGVIAYRPMGVIAAITAYNYPFTLVANKVGAALAAGCTVVLLPSLQTPLSALLIARLAVEAGLPGGVLNVVVGGAEIARELTLGDVDKVSFTGSVGVGSLVMQQAAQGIKGVVLELGGKNPNIVLPGVDVAPLVGDIHRRYVRNAGQGCGSTTRIFVHESQYDEFVQRSQAMWHELKVGDPWDPETVSGPVISAAHRDRVLGYIRSALDDGGEIIAQGEVPSRGPGYWVPPTLLGNVPHNSRAVQEEIFGPVGVAFSYADLDEVAQLSNDTVYGLGANIYTRRVPEALALAARLRAGNITINGGGASTPLSLTGGFKKSGVGRETGILGIREFLEPQSIRWPL